jgi:hypothetical protein
MAQVRTATSTMLDDRMRLCGISQHVAIEVMCKATLEEAQFLRVTDEENCSGRTRV